MNITDKKARHADMIKNRTRKRKSTRRQEEMLRNCCTNEEIFTAWER